MLLTAILKSNRLLAHVNNAQAAIKYVASSMILLAQAMVTSTARQSSQTVRHMESWMDPAKNRSLFLLMISQYFLSIRIFPLTASSAARSA